MEGIDIKLSGGDVDKRFNWEEIIEKYKIPLLLGLVGIILVGVGILAVIFSSQSQDKIEIIPSKETSSREIFVDIEGAVVKPGVYELSSGSRVNDLLIAAGGLSAEADRDWLERSLNKAGKLADGAKFYIPKAGESVKDITSTTGITGSSSGGLVNINTASKSELEALWGIGPATAQKMIDSRPYQNVEELLAKKILYRNVYQRIESQLTVY